MDLQVNKLPEDPAALKEIITKLFSEYERSREKVQYLEEYIRLLRNEIFGKKSEKRPWQNPHQLLLFQEAAQQGPTEEDDASEPVPVAAHTRKKQGRKPLPAPFFLCR